MTLNVEIDEAQHIEIFRARLREQAAKAEFDHGPFEKATAFLESLPPTEFADDRVRLAWEICVVAGTSVRPDLSRRALHAAFPTGSKLKDKQLERKWLTGTGALEAARGNIQVALKCKINALKLSEELGDRAGTCAEWGNLAFIAAGAGLYQDVIAYSTAAMNTGGLSANHLSEHYGNNCMNRANAYLRLGRLADAANDIAGCLASISYPATGRMVDRLVGGQYTYCEIALERGDRAAARAALSAAATWADRSGIPELKLQVDRVSALLSVAESGPEVAVATLESLLAKAIEMEAKQGGSSLDDSVLDVLHSLERVCRDSGDLVSAYRWLNEIGSKMRKNTEKIVTALAENTYLSNTLAVEAKMSEIDSYLYSKSVVVAGRQTAGLQAWSNLVGLAASASSVEDATKEHGLRVARLAGLVAQELGVSTGLLEGIEAGCLVHDVGKVGVPSSVLLKATTLEDDEQELYSTHPRAGAELVERITVPHSTIVQNVIRFHHHPYDGDTAHYSPRGEAIPLEARIASVCDEYDSLVTGRPRRPAVCSADALREIFSHRSEKFDPMVVDAFVAIVRGLERTHSDLQAYLSEEAERIEYFAMQRTLKRAAERALSKD